MPLTFCECSSVRPSSPYSHSLHHTPSLAGCRDHWHTQTQHWYSLLGSLLPNTVSIISTLQFYLDFDNCSCVRCRSSSILIIYGYGCGLDVSTFSSLYTVPLLSQCAISQLFSLHTSSIHLLLRLFPFTTKVFYIFALFLSFFGHCLWHIKIALCLCDCLLSVFKRKYFEVVKFLIRCRLLYYSNRVTACFQIGTDIGLMSRRILKEKNQQRT